MKPVFSIKKDERLMIGEKYITNGHWMLTRHSINTSCLAPKILKPALNMLHGRHEYETVTPMEESTFDGIIPKRDGYQKLDVRPTGVSFKNDTEILSYKFQTEDRSETGFEVRISEGYVPLLAMGIPFAKSPDAPVMLLDADRLDSELIGLIMPMRA